MRALCQVLSPKPLHPLNATVQLVGPPPTPAPCGDDAGFDGEGLRKVRGILPGLEWGLFLLSLDGHDWRDGCDWLVEAEAPAQVGVLDLTRMIRGAPMARSSCDLAKRLPRRHSSLAEDVTGSRGLIVRAGCDLQSEKLGRLSHWKSKKSGSWSGHVNQETPTRNH